MKYFSIAVLAFSSFLLATPAQAISFSIGRHGVSVGTNHGYGHGWRRGYYPPAACYYDSWGRYICPQPRAYYPPPPVVVYPYKHKKWKKRHKRRHHRRR